MRREFNTSFVPFSEQDSWRKALSAGEFTWAGQGLRIPAGTRTVDSGKAEG